MSVPLALFPLSRFLESRIDHTTTITSLIFALLLILCLLANGYSRCVCSSGLIMDLVTLSKEVDSRLCYQSHRFPSVEYLCLRTPFTLTKAKQGNAARWQLLRKSLFSASA
jgi:hypothetical protein